MCKLTSNVPLNVLNKGFQYIYNNNNTQNNTFCLSVPGFSSYLRIFHLWRRHFCLWRVANFDLYLTLMDIEQLGFFSVSHLLWHGTSVYNGHLWGPVTRTHIAERFALELSMSVFTTCLNTQKNGLILTLF